MSRKEEKRKSKRTTCSVALAANRTRGPSMATMDFTTKPLMLKRNYFQLLEEGVVRVSILVMNTIENFSCSYLKVRASWVCIVGWVTRRTSVVLSVEGCEISALGTRPNSVDQISCLQCIRISIALNHSSQLAFTDFYQSMIFVWEIHCFIIVFEDTNCQA
jgi:hypothetical protein